MRLNPVQRRMLANAKALVATVSRQAELAKDAPLAHALAEAHGALHSLIESSRPALRVHKSLDAVLPFSGRAEP